MRTAFVVLLAATALTAQILPDRLFPPQLRAYFAFTDAQVSRINELNQQLQAFRLGKLARQAQVQREIAEEAQKDNPNPTALGSSYVELEAIRRELETEQQKTVRQVQAVLTLEQKTKLAVLEQVFALQATACSAVDQNLLRLPPIFFAPNPFPVNVLPGIRIDIGSLASGTCGIRGLTGIPLVIP